MQAIIESMRQLQEVLIEHIAIEKKLEEIPKILDQKEEILRRLQQVNGEKQVEKDTVDEQLKGFKVSLTEVEDLLAKLENQISEIGTQREYEALEKEIQIHSNKETQIRKEMIALEKQSQELSEKIGSEHEMIEEQRVELEKAQEDVRELKTEYETKLNDLASQAEDISVNLDAELVFKFERIIRSKGGKGILPLRKNICTGCNMILPNQFVNDVRDADSISFCTYCSTILYYSDESDGEEVVEEETGTLGEMLDLDDDFEDSDFDFELENYDSEVSSDDDAEIDSKESEVDEDDHMEEEEIEEDSEMAPVADSNEEEDDEFSFETDEEDAEEDEEES